jgi:hypothetical protein
VLGQDAVKAIPTISPTRAQFERRLVGLRPPISL